MNIDPLKAFTSTQTNSLRQPPTAAPQAHQQSFEALLGAATASALSAPPAAREANELVRMANLQLLQGLFDPNLEASEDSLSSLLTMIARRFELSSAASKRQKVDLYVAAPPEYQPSQLSPTQGSRKQIEQLIDRVAEQVSLPSELIRSVVSVESNFSPDAVSSAGAQGLMQLMPATARELEVADSFDPQQNLLGGSRYLKQLLDKYDGDLDHALAAYNWGQGNVDRKGLAQMPQETSDYLVKVRERLMSV